MNDFEHGAGPGSADGDGAPEESAQRYDTGRGCLTLIAVIGGFLIVMVLTAMLAGVNRGV
ncbi:MAG: hypothetical protein JJ916_15085 [Phycisphaerales bacterium]|nr:hypothetical protein [Phycisphaerales bacterium]